MQNIRRSGFGSWGPSVLKIKSAGSVDSSPFITGELDGGDWIG